MTMLLVGDDALVAFFDSRVGQSYEVEHAAACAVDFDGDERGVYSLDSRCENFDKHGIIF